MDHSTLQEEVRRDQVYRSDADGLLHVGSTSRRPGPGRREGRGGHGEAFATPTGFSFPSAIASLRSPAAARVNDGGGRRDEMGRWAGQLDVKRGDAGRGQGEII
ncbi:hypothetical protein EYF80_029385 [Liparis tanakae]|uniref:Uncharacterized protein n=1 Tax=Liparis tanakae TaxID=230148 RepID=A0A4Z2H3K6_9TELE|nr:hypothetical protein EYF80_029385 [Liparis tanakae]